MANGHRSIQKLLKQYSQIMRELKNRRILRSSNNPTSDYAEYLVCRKYGMQLAPKVTKSFDAIDKRGKRVQVKSRRLTRENQTQLLGVIRGYKRARFDYVLGVIFNEDFSLKEIWKVPKRAIANYTKYRSYQNGHIINLAGPIRRDKRVKQLY